MANPSDGDGDVNQLLCRESSANSDRDSDVRGGLEEESMTAGVWIDTRKLWHITRPAIISGVAKYSMNVVTQAFAGQLGKVELATMSITNKVILGFNFGLMLGMVSALETRCVQAFGEKQNHLLGTYAQRSWIVLLLCCFLSLPLHMFVTPLPKLLGQSDDKAALSGTIALWFIPMRFRFAFVFPLSKFLQSQLKTVVTTWVSLIGLLVSVVTSWACVYVFDLGMVGLCVVLDLSRWLMVSGLYSYSACEGCAFTWTDEAFSASGLREFFELSAASEVMIRILTLMTGFVQNATIAVDALSICMSIDGREMIDSFCLRRCNWAHKPFT